MANAIVLPDPPYEIVCDTDDEQEWLAHRSEGIGASEVGALLGIGHRSSPVKLFYEKLGILEPDDLSDIEAVQWGHTLEPVIADVFAKRTGRKVVRGRKHRFQTLRSKEHPWAMASLDFWNDAGGGEIVPLEVKNVTAYKAEDWINGAPDYFLAQIQQQLLVTGARKGTSACLLGGNRLLWCDVDRDEMLVRKIVFHATVFWERVKQRTPPEPDGSEATRETLARLFPADDGSVVVLPAALESYVYEWRDLKTRVSQDKKRIDFLENSIKATLGNATRGVFHNGDAVSWKQQSVREHTVKGSTFRVLRFHESK